MFWLRQIKGSVEKVIKTVLNNIYFHLIEPKHFDSPLNDYFIILNQFWATKQSKAWKIQLFFVSLNWLSLKVYLHDSTYVELKWLQNLNSSELNNMHIKIAETIIELKVSKKLNDV